MRKKLTPFPYLSREPLTGGEKNYADKMLKEFKKSAKAYNKRMSKSPKAALQALIATGMYTKTGRLKKAFR